MFDNIHLNDKGYFVLAKHCIDVLYRDWLLNPLPLDQPSQNFASNTPQPASEKPALQ